jgi:hypothetical protein
MNSFASLLGKMGKKKESKFLKQEAKKIFSRFYGPNHPSTRAAGGSTKANRRN